MVELIGQCLYNIGHNVKVAFTIVQRNFDITKYQGTGKICSLLRGFVISGYFSIHFTITELKILYTGCFFTSGFHCTNIVRKVAPSIMP